MLRRHPESPFRQTLSRSHAPRATFRSRAKNIGNRGRQKLVNSFLAPARNPLSSFPSFVWSSSPESRGMALAPSRVYIHREKYTHVPCVPCEYAREGRDSSRIWISTRNLLPATFSPRRTSRGSLLEFPHPRITRIFDNSTGSVQKTKNTKLRSYFKRESSCIIRCE